LAVAKLSRVVLVCSRGEFGKVLAELCAYGRFHPSESEDLVQDPQVLLVASHLHEVYSRSKAILGRSAVATAGRRDIASADAFALPKDLGASLDALERAPRSRDGAIDDSALGEVKSIGDAAQAVFDDLIRVRVRPGPKRFVVMEGYVPTNDAGRFEGALARYLVSATPVVSRASFEPYVPTLLVNPKVVSLFESTTLAQGVPSYNEIDPTPFIAFFFPFFFGLMFADIGRGMAVLAAGWFVGRKWGEKYGYWGNMLYVLGASTIFFGLFSGLFFGLHVPTPFPHFIPVLDLTGLDIASVVFLLEVSVVVGTFHLATAYYIAFANEFRAGNRVSVFTHLPVLTLYAGLVPFAFAVVGNGLSFGGLLTDPAPAPVFRELLGLSIPVGFVASVSLPFVLGSLLVLVFGRATFDLVRSRSSRNVVRSLVAGTMSALAQSFEFLVNTISYIRLGVLLIVSTLTGALVNQALGWGAAGVPVVVAANVGVMILEGLIVYVQDLRLHVYEWFTKMYLGRGTAFRPLVASGATFRIRWGFRAA
jgi:V/A-type H+/Na+-transporting ATPase subunit I